METVRERPAEYTKTDLVEALRGKATEARNAVEALIEHGDLVQVEVETTDSMGRKRRKEVMDVP